MSIIAKPYTFSPNTTAASSQVNSNFDTLYNDYNGGISAANLATDAVTTAKIADSNVTTAKLADGSVTAAKIAEEAWEDWTPTWTNFTPGNGTLYYAKYMQVGKTVYFRLRFVLGSTSAVSGDLNVSLPIAGVSGYQNGNSEPIGNASFVDAGTAIIAAGVFISSTDDSTAVIRAINASGTYAGFVAISSTIPFTWTTSDRIEMSGFYEAA